MSELCIQDVSVYYHGRRRDVAALDHFSATFTDGMNVIVGYSGCGKTTLLNAILGLTHYEGQILFNGRDLSALGTGERGFSYVSQDLALFPQSTVFDNIAFPLKMLGAERGEITRRVREIAELTDLTHCLMRSPKHISGGQQQRVAIARALVKRPAVCLLDEPFSNADELLRVRMRRWMRDVFAETGCMALYVTHDLREALALADRLYVMNEGTLALAGTPQEVIASGDEVIADLRAASGMET